MKDSNFLTLTRLMALTLVGFFLAAPVLAVIPGKLRSTTQADRQAAADRLAAARQSSVILKAAAVGPLITAAGPVALPLAGTPPGLFRRHNAQLGMDFALAKIC